MRRSSKLWAHPFVSQFPSLSRFSNNQNENPNGNDSGDKSNNSNKNNNNNQNNGNENDPNDKDPNKDSNLRDQFMEYTNPSNWDPRNLKILGFFGFAILINYFFKDYWEYEMVSNIDQLDFWAQLENRDIKALEVEFFLNREDIRV